MSMVKNSTHENLCERNGEPQPLPKLDVGSLSTSAIFGFNSEWRRHDACTKDVCWDEMLPCRASAERGKAQRLCLALQAPRPCSKQPCTCSDLGSLTLFLFAHTLAAAQLMNANRESSEFRAELVEARMKAQQVNK